MRLKARWNAFAKLIFVELIDSHPKTMSAVLHENDALTRIS